MRAFAYDSAGQMIEARVFTQTTEFAYNGLGARLAVSVDGYGTTRYTLDYAAGNRILAETTPTETVQYLYGHDCLGEQRDAEWLYYCQFTPDNVPVIYGKDVPPFDMPLCLRHCTLTVT